MSRKLMMNNMASSGEITYPYSISNIIRGGISSSGANNTWSRWREDTYIPCENLDGYKVVLELYSENTLVRNLSPNNLYYYNENKTFLESTSWNYTTVDKTKGKFFRWDVNVADVGAYTIRPVIILVKEMI